MSRYAKRFWQMNAAQKAKAQAIETRHAPWRSMLVKKLYALTPRWLLGALAILCVAGLVLSKYSIAAQTMGYALTLFFFAFLGVDNLLQGWSFSSRGRILFTGVPSALLGIAFLALAIAGVVMLLG